MYPHFVCLKDSPVLIIGHHILHGKVLNLEKPLAVLVKTTEDSGAAAMETDHAAESRKTCYDVKAIIKKKILFKTRPKPIIAHVPKKL